MTWGRLSGMITYVDFYEDLKGKATGLGADLFGVAETSKLQKYLDDEIIEPADDLPFTVSIAVRLHRKVFDSLKNGPNVLYKHHYKTANLKLDDIILRLGNYIQNKGFSSLPIPASVYTNWDRQTAHFSQRHAAIESGIGFQGLNGLVIHPEFGASIRLASLLTDMPLHSDSPLIEDCGNCRACVAACPVDAISTLGPDHFDGQACYDRLKKHAAQRGMGVYICGLCIKACKGSNIRRKS